MENETDSFNPSQAESNQRIVLILTGSFNPVTIAHLHTLQFARDYYQARSIQVLEGILSPVSDSYGKPGLINAKYRIEMLQAATRDEPWLRVNTWEAEQPTWTRTKLVLDHHHELVKKKYGDDVGLRLLAGADVVRSMSIPGIWSPEDIDDIVMKYGIACTTRMNPLVDEEDSPRDIDAIEGMPDLWKDHIDIISDWLIHNISSTKIRSRLASGYSVKYIVPDGIIEIIRKYTLYCS